jgi:hypothetical protein
VLARNLVHGKDQNSKGAMTVCMAPYPVKPSRR